jgi:hypothetical protein
MSDHDPDLANSKETDSASPSSDTTFEAGRYLYCAVTLDGSEGEANGSRGADGDDGTTPTDVGTEFPTGIDDEPVHLVSLADRGIGVVVHPCESLYDTDEMARLHKWLLDHQRVIDAAGERFGTPLPFRFDTIVTGDDERVREWVAESAETLGRYLEAFAGCWEYRIEVTADETDLEDGLEATDDRLADLAARIDEASSGTGFLLRKQYDQRLAELKRARREERSAALEERLASLAREVHRVDESRSSLVDGETTADSNPDTNSGTDSEAETHTQARLTVLAHEEREAAIGEMLDEVAAEPGITVRFTGPWPPYTFAPEIDGGGE